MQKVTVAGIESARIDLVAPGGEAFDAVIAPYHDVGMTAIKVAAFGRAVNVTLGLPFPRTSPDRTSSCIRVWSTWSGRSSSRCVTCRRIV